jgi:hypothetical protein
VLVVLERMSSGFAGFGVAVVVVVVEVLVPVVVVFAAVLVVTADIVVVVLVTGVVVTEVAVPQATVMRERATKPITINTCHSIGLPESQFFIFLLGILLDIDAKKIGRPSEAPKKQSLLSHLSFPNTGGVTVSGNALWTPCGNPAVKIPCLAVPGKLTRRAEILIYKSTLSGLKAQVKNKPNRPQSSHSKL